MSPVPAHQLTNPLQTLADWEAARTQLAALKQHEHLLRMAVFNHFFPSPKEGTNTHVLPTQWQVKAKYPITRDVDQDVLDGVKRTVVGQLTPEQRLLYGINPAVPAETPFFEALLLDIDTLVRYKPELQTTAYRTLTAEQARAVELFLTTKPGSPQVEIVEPAKPRGGAKKTAEPSESHGAAE